MRSGGLIPKFAAKAAKAAKTAKTVGAVYGEISKLTSVIQAPNAKGPGEVDRSKAANVIWSGVARRVGGQFRSYALELTKLVNLVNGDTERIYAMAAAVSDVPTDGKGMLLTEALREALG